MLGLCVQTVDAGTVFLFMMCVCVCVWSREDAKHSSRCLVVATFKFHVDFVQWGKQSLGADAYTPSPARPERPAECTDEASKNVELVFLPLPLSSDFAFAHPCLQAIVRMGRKPNKGPT